MLWTRADDSCENYSESKFASFIDIFFYCVDYLLSNVFNLGIELGSVGESSFPFSEYNYCRRTYSKT